jgi:superfamily II DNA or RNA helicase
MPKYPNINDDKFYKKINDIYKEYRIKKDEKTLEDICYPKKYKLQLPQKFLAEFINPKTQYKGILVYHKIGAGKTCAAVRIAEKWKKYKRIIVVVPASLKNNFRGELRSMCADDNYLTKKERDELKKHKPTDKRYKEIIKISDKRIDEHYDIYSYNKFVELAGNKKLKLKNSLLIVDEIQNMVSEDGSFYNALYDIIKKSPEDLRIVLLSATPMFDKPNEIALTMNLLRIPNELPIGRDFDKKFISVKKKKNGDIDYDIINGDVFKKAIKGYVSFFRGAPQVAFPKMSIKYVECEMSDFQYNSYLKLLKQEEKMEKKSSKKSKKFINNLDVSDLPNNFYIGTRMISNIVFPNRKVNAQGYKSLTTKKILNNLEKYSCKFFEIMEKIERSSGKIFVYSNFKEYGGIKAFKKVLKAYGYKDYIKYGSGHKRYALWSGDESISIKEEIKSVYNAKDNLKGKQIKILLGSPSIKEGVSLTAVRQVHVMESYWNRSRLDQVIGRASRYCSHKDLNDNSRKVKVYIYVAVVPYRKNKESFETVDQYIRKLSVGKEKIIKKFEELIKEAAIDCNLNKNSNNDDGNEDIKCDK